MADIIIKSCTIKEQVHYPEKEYSKTALLIVVGTIGLAIGFGISLVLIFRFHSIEIGIISLIISIMHCIICCSIGYIFDLLYKNTYKTSEYLIDNINCELHGILETAIVHTVHAEVDNTVSANLVSISVPKK